MLDELVEDRLISSEINSPNGAEVPLQGFIAMNKLITWAKQVSFDAFFLFFSM
jgi:hypothetical protein